jgi:membrane protease YdiL (CAAX protease family)
MRLWLEFLSLYVAAPLALALVLPPDALFPGLLALTVVGLALLGSTPGFCWSDLTRGIRRIGWFRVLCFTVSTGMVGATVVAATDPSTFLALPRELPGLMLAIAVLYPPVSALPQEILFRPLFFRRYGALLPQRPAVQVGLNAALFSAAHLVYWNWIVAAMTFAGGLVFAWSYRIRGNFPEAVVLHSLAGIVLFAVGLGMFFYSGNIVRPF